MDIPILESSAFVLSLSHIRLFGTPWTIALQTPLSMGFSSQEYWRALPFPHPRDPGDLPRSEIVPTSPALAGWLLIAKPPGKPLSKLRLPQQSTTDWVAEAEMPAFTVTEARSS